MEAGQEARRVVDVLARVEHILDAAEMRGMIVMVDLHAAQIDQRLALALRIGEGGKRFGPALWEDRFSFYIQCIRLKAAFVAGLGQADGIKDAGGHAIAIGGAQDLGLAGIGGGSRGVGEAR